MFDKTITLFNHYQSSTGDMWFPHIIKGVQLTTDKATMIAKYGEKSSDNALVHIRFTKDKNSRMIAGLPVLAPKEWENLTNDELAKNITFKSGENFDFFMVGEYAEESIKDDDYLKGFYNYMNSKYDYVYAITNVASYDLIPHYEITGR